MKAIFFALLVTLAFCSPVTIVDCGTADTIARFPNLNVTDIKPGSTTTVHTNLGKLIKPLESGSSFFEGWLNGGSLGSPVQFCMCGECTADYAFGLGKVHYYGPSCPRTGEWPDTKIDVKFPFILLPGDYKIDARGVTDDGEEAYCIRFTWKY
ncbi:hypothetical protein WA158_006503 [Blastocystis sp. Blastoise]